MYVNNPRLASNGACREFGLRKDAHGRCKDSLFPVSHQLLQALGSQCESVRTPDQPSSLSEAIRTKRFIF